MPVKDQEPSKGKQPKKPKKPKTKGQPSAANSKGSAAAGKKKTLKKVQQANVKPAKEGKATSKSKVIKGKKLKKKEEEEPEFDLDEKIIKKTIKFTKKVDYENLSGEDFKAAVRDELPKFKYAKLVIYWTRPSCAVSLISHDGDDEESTDVGHFIFNKKGFQGTPACKTMVACAMGLQLVSWIENVKVKTC